LKRGIPYETRADPLYEHSHRGGSVFCHPNQRVSLWYQNIKFRNGMVVVLEYWYSRSRMFQFQLLAQILTVIKFKTD
jgi:hypothetical protein